MTPNSPRQSPVQQPTSHSGSARLKRRLLWLIVALSALGIGIGLGLTRLAPQPATPAGWLFELSYPQPSGQTTPLAEARGRLTIVNLWASWCLPCVEEMPDLSRFHSDLSSSGIQVVGLALDSPSNVRDFLEATPVSYPIFIVGAAGTEIGRRLGNAVDALPFTAMVDESGNVVKQKLGKITQDELRSWVNERQSDKK